jgi:hypothetical protein
MLGRVDCLPVECLAVQRPRAFTRRSSEAGDRWPVQGRAGHPDCIYAANIGLGLEIK